jgi:hypothetical protein
MLSGAVHLAAQRFFRDVSLWRKEFQMNIEISEIKILQKK